jgi:coilin
MEEEETKVPVRVRLVFADRNLLSKAQKSEGLRRSWVVISPDHKTVAEFCRNITSRFGLSTTSSHVVLLSVGLSKNLMCL